MKELMVSDDISQNLCLPLITLIYFSLLLCLSSGRVLFLLWTLPVSSSCLPMSKTTSELRPSGQALSWAHHWCNWERLSIILGGSKPRESRLQLADSSQQHSTGCRINSRTAGAKQNLLKKTQQLASEEGKKNRPIAQWWIGFQTLYTLRIDPSAVHTHTQRERHQ